MITGFRVAYGGAQALYGVTPDLTCLGKIIGGGLPVGAYGGRREIMEMLAPLGPVYQAGTLSGNPLAMAAGLATLRELQSPGFYERLDALSSQLVEGVARAAASAGVSLRLNRVGSMLTPFFADAPVTDYASARRCRHGALRPLLPRDARARRLPRAVAVRGGVLSSAHGESEIADTIAAAEASFAEIA